jgi:imidazolonepropionase
MGQTTLIRGARSIFQTRDKIKGPLRLSEMSVLPATDNGYVLIEDGVIRQTGPMAEVPERADQIVDATDRLVVPCWCDSHTHLVYAASREQEFVDRIHGLSYEMIARRGGGILNSARVLEHTSADDLFDAAWERLNEVVRFGTGAIEIKSGYGLSHAAELKMLRVIRRIREKAPIPVKATFLGAHAIPSVFKNDRQGYLRIITDEMLPEIAGEGLADYIDVFCDEGFYTVDETSRILEAGTKYGLKPKIHVNELANSGGVQIGLEHNALSVDHLERIGEEEIKLLSKSETISTLLPSCAFFLNIPYAPARALIDSGAAVALATDYNPGSTPSGRMPFVISLACIKMRMTPEESINAATINGACAMELQSAVGSISPGKLGNVIITKPVPSLAYIPYAFGSDHIEKVIIEGKVWA